MDSNNEKLFDQDALNEPHVEAFSGVNRCDLYANGPDYYVLSLRQNAVGAPAPQPIDATAPKSQPEGPVCPYCGNAIALEMKFCPECGAELPKT